MRKKKKGIDWGKAIMADVKRQQKHVRKQAAARGLPVDKAPRYAGIIGTPTHWWASHSRLVYDAWDWPHGPVRDAVLTQAERLGVLHCLGPASMDSAHVNAAMMRTFGEEITAEEVATMPFVTLTERGRDFMDGTGEFD